MWVPLLRPFPGNEAPKLFSGGPESGVLCGGGGGKKCMLKKFRCFFCPLPVLVREFRLPASVFDLRSAKMRVLKSRRRVPKHAFLEHSSRARRP